MFHSLSTAVTLRHVKRNVHFVQSTEYAHGLSRKSPRFDDVVGYGEGFEPSMGHVS